MGGAPGQRAGPQRRPAHRGSPHPPGTWPTPRPPDCQQAPDHAITGFDLSRHHHLPRRKHHASTSYRPQGCEDGHHRQCSPASRPPRRKAPGQALTASRECPWSGPGARLDVRSGPDHERAALQIVGLIIFQDELRARPRQAGPAGVPVLTEAAAMIRLLPRRRAGPGPHRGRCRRGHARARADRGRAPAVRRPGRRPAGGRRRPQDGDHGHRQRSPRTVALNGQARTRGSGAGRLMYAGACRGESRRCFQSPATEKDV